jgi:KDO2-lipid IV(A) lauroyltransferase
MNIVRLYRWAIRLLPHLPEPLIYALCDGAALATLLANPAIRRNIRRNLAHTQPRSSPWHRLVLSRRVLAYVLRHYADMLRLPAFSRAALRQRFEITGLEHLDLLVAGGVGGMMAVPHCGSFSTILACLAELGYPLVLVVERIEPPELLSIVSELRRSHGLEVLTLGPTAGRDVLRALRANNIVVLAGDRDLAAQPIRLPFFGTPADVPSGLARLAIRGVPVVTAFTAWLDSGRAFARIDPALHLDQQPAESAEAAIERAAQAIVRRLESYIAAFPASWGVLQPVWPPAEPEQ